MSDPLRLYFPVSTDDYVSLEAGTFNEDQLAGLDRIETDNSGADDDATWVVAEFDPIEVDRYEESDSPELLGCRSFILPNALLHSRTWRRIPPDDAIHLTTP